MKDKDHLMEEAQRRAEGYKPKPLSPTEYAWQISVYAFIALLFTEGLVFLKFPRMWAAIGMLLAVYIMAKQDNTYGWKRYKRSIRQNLEALQSERPLNRSGRSK